MGLPNSELQILAAIENELQADRSLGPFFSTFTLVTRSEGMPAAEQLGTPNSLTGWRSFRRLGLTTFLGRLTVTVAVAVVTALAAVLVALPGGHQNRCEPAGTALRARYATPCVPLGSAGHPLPPYFRPPKGHM
jgi:hypothetical protein